MRHNKKKEGEKSMVRSIKEGKEKESKAIDHYHHFDGAQLRRYGAAIWFMLFLSLSLSLRPGQAGPAGVSLSLSRFLSGVEIYRVGTVALLLPVLWQFILISRPARLKGDNEGNNGPPRNHWHVLPSWNGHKSAIYTQRNNNNSSFVMHYSSRRTGRNLLAIVINQKKKTKEKWPLMTEVIQAKKGFVICFGLPAVFFHSRLLRHSSYKAFLVDDDYPFHGWCHHVASVRSY